MEEHNLLLKITTEANATDTTREFLQKLASFIFSSFSYNEILGVSISYNSCTIVEKEYAESYKNLVAQYSDIKHGELSIYLYYKELTSAITSTSDMLRVHVTSIYTLIIQKKYIQHALPAEHQNHLFVIQHIRTILKQAKGVSETLQIVAQELSQIAQFPSIASACIKYENVMYYSTNFRSSQWSARESFVTFDNNAGYIEIFYTSLPACNQSEIFTHEEKTALAVCSMLIQGFLNDLQGRMMLNQPHDSAFINAELYRETLTRNKRPLQHFLNKQILDKYIYLDMMKYKVTEILFVATLYDAYNLEKDDSFFEKFMGPIYQYSVFSLPRIIAVSSHEEALDLLHKNIFDMVVLMVGAEVQDPIELGKKIKMFDMSIPIYLLLNQRSNVTYFQEYILQTSLFDKLFIWNGDSQIFFAMVKSLEDMRNAENDTKIGLVRTILLIEDSPYYYSKYLPAIYSVLFKQIGNQIADYEMNELEKISRMRSRPKLLWARSFEQASFLYNKYRDYINCIICDGEFEQSGIVDTTSGTTFLKKIREGDVNIPILIQSGDDSFEKLAKKLKASFVHKNSNLLLNRIKRFVMHNFGYGDFVFRDSKGKKIGRAKNLREFKSMLNTIPDDSLAYHAKQNQFSIWLMGRGEIDLATKINPIQLTDFADVSGLRQKNIEVFEEYKQTKKRGKIVSFEETVEFDEKSIVSLSPGSIGGKGRGLAFANALIHNSNFEEYADRLHVTTPRTAVIGANEFEKFIKSHLSQKNIYEKNYSELEIKKMFAAPPLSNELRKKLIVFLEQIKTPIAVRSSSIFEDSLNQPVAGLFSTYVIPNNGSFEKRLHDLETAIKLVFASVFTPNVKSYYTTTYHKLEEEKMAVILQSLAGRTFNSYFYPHMSGVAQSHNFYPVSYMKPEEGFAVSAVGLGYYVVDGGKAYRYSPAHPKIQTVSLKSLVQNSQTEFIAVDMEYKDYDFVTQGERAALKLLPISEAETHKTLNHCVSVYNPENDTLEPGVSGVGPRVVNFSNILEHEYIPLTHVITAILDTVKDAMGTAVEIEYAIDLTKNADELPTFYLLQIKPLLGTTSVTPDIIESLSDKTPILQSSIALGNGLYTHIEDIIYIKNQQFDKMQTLEMAKEIEEINKMMIEQKKQYILIGPGRWGSSDRFLGIPVQWTQISQAKIIVEISLDNFPLDSSLGSHFFHNITSMNIGYLAIEHKNEQNFIDWNFLEKQEKILETQFFTHKKLSNPCIIRIDGNNHSSTIYV